MADIASQAHVRASEPLALAASKLCVYLWDTAWQSAPQVLEGDDEALHDMRVALRRLRSALENSAALGPGFLRQDIAKEMRAERRSLSKIGDALGAVRDFDVLSKYLGDYIKEELGQDPGKHGGLDRFGKYLQHRREASFAPMQHAIEHADRARRGGKHGSRREEFSRWAHSLAGVSQPQAPLQEAARQVLAMRIDEALAMGVVLQSSDEHEQHNLRKSLRRLRYTLETFAPAFEKKKAKPLLKTLASMQDELGEMQDRSVLRAMLLGCFEAGSIEKLPADARRFAQFGEAKRGELLQGMRATWDTELQSGFWDAMRAA